MRLYKPVINLCAVLSIILSCGNASAENVTFQTIPSKKHGTTKLAGHLSRPDASGKYPAVIIVHGCGGISNNHYDWANRLGSWGYVTLIVDSFGPRKVAQVCTDPRKVRPDTRAYDVFGAVKYLRSLDFVDSKRIGVIGFSHGGWTSLYVAQDYFSKNINMEEVQAVVAYYPWCQQFKLKTTKTPLLILAGDKDDWTPSSMCEKFVKEQKSGYEENVTLRIYPGAYHTFDDSGIIGLERYLGHIIGHNPGAAAKSIKETKQFFEGHLKN